MNRNKYEKITSFFKNNKAANTALKIIYKYLPLLIFILYPIGIVWVFFKQNEIFFQFVLVPLGVFLMVTALRKLINEQRPYEKYGIEPVFAKNTKGKSMPSRHTASAFIISMAMLRINPYLGIGLLVVSFVIMISRVLAGVHYIRDVFVGMTISIVIGYVFLFLI